MDGDRVDQLARTLAAGAPRRRVLLGLGGLALGALGLSAARGAAAQVEAQGCRARCRRRCERRCENNNRPNRCENRCRDRCEERRCD
jgi:hypothetical protein